MLRSYWMDIALLGKFPPSSITLIRWKLLETELVS